MISLNQAFRSLQTAGSRRRPEGCKLRRREPSQARVWPVVVVLEAPGFDPQAGLCKGIEPARLETISAQRPIEALDEAVLDRPPGTDEPDLDSVLRGPAIEGLAGELRPLSTQSSRGLPRSATSRSSTRTTRSAGNDRSTSMARLSRWNWSSTLSSREARPVQGVLHEVHRPTLGRCRGGHVAAPGDRRDQLFARLLLQAQLLEPVEAQDPLAIHRGALPPKLEPEQVAGVPEPQSRQLQQPSSDPRVVAATAVVAHRRTVRQRQARGPGFA